MSTQHFEFGDLPVGASIIGPLGDMYVKRFSHSMTRTDAGAELVMQDVDEVCVDVTGTLRNLLRDMLNPFEEGTCQEVLAAIQLQRTLRAKQFLELIDN